MNLRKILRTVVTFAVVFGVTGLAMVGANPVAVLEYFDNDFEMTIVDADDFEYDFYLGMDLLPGDTILTRNSTAEIRLQPNGSILKIGANSRFQIEAIQGRAGATSNNFQLFSGRVRSVAATVAGANYQVRTPSAVGGVRGTDFGMEVVPGEVDALVVFTGRVEFLNPATGQSFLVNPGEYIDIFADIFQPIQLTQEQLNELLSQLPFEALDPAEVPSDPVVDAPTDEPDDPEAPVTDPAVVVDEPTTTDPVTIDPAITDDPGVLDPLFNFLGEYVGMEIGSVTIDGRTYSKLTLNPHIQVGRLRAGLYLPIIYTNNLFDPDDWHKPGGNNEWSFGTDQEKPVDMALDFLTDLSLKIRYIEWGQQRDPFFFKVGNLNNMTVGHGILMMNYANDADFPAVRRVGLNLGIDRGGFGIESVVNDVARPEIFGGRVFFRPIGENFPLAVGISGITDISPASGIPEDTGVAALENARVADPAFINTALDIDIPIIETSLLSIVLFGDVGGLVPYVRNPVDDVDAGLKFDALVDIDSMTFKNYGIMTGVFGNILNAGYRLEFRKFDGVFRPYFYDGTYDRLRGGYAADVVTYLGNPTDPQYQSTLMGVYGESTFGLFNMLEFRIGYLWPWESTADGTLQGSEDDFLTVTAGVQSGLLPLGISGDVTYSRTKFVPTLLDGTGELSLFDANTVLSGEIVYPLAPGFNLVGMVTTTVLRNDDGTIRYENGRPVSRPSITIETRIGF